MQGEEGCAEEVVGGEDLRASVGLVRSTCDKMECLMVLRGQCNVREHVARAEMKGG